MDPQALYQKHIALGATPEQAAAVVRAVMDAQNPANYVSQGFGAEGGGMVVDAGAEDRAAQQFPYYANVIANGQNSFWEQIRPLASVLGAAAVGGYAAGGSAGAGAGAGSAGGSAGAAGGAAGASEAGYLAAADAAGGMAPAYGTSGGYSAGIGAGTGGATTAGASAAGASTVAPAASAAPAAGAGSMWTSPAFMNTLGSVGSAVLQRNAAKDASQAQQAAAQAGIAEQSRQFDAVQGLLRPYVNAGSGALAGQQDLIGQNGSPAQQAAIDALRASPQFQSMLKQGEGSILANASATGGLRGGNTQAALAQFSPQLLSQLIDQQYSRLGGLTSLGQNSAVMQGNAGMQTGNNITNLLQQQGAYQAGSALAGGRFGGQVINGITQGFGMYAGMQQPTGGLF